MTTKKGPGSTYRSWDSKLADILTGIYCIKIGPNVRELECSLSSAWSHTHNLKPKRDSR